MCGAWLLHDRTKDPLTLTTVSVAPSSSKLGRCIFVMVHLKRKDWSMGFSLLC